MVNTSHLSEYPIAAVSKLTGVSCHALRVWERRYGFPRPHRSPSGHRRYSPEQVQTLRWLSERLHHGGSIGELMRQVREGRVDLSAVLASPESDPGSRTVRALVDHLCAGEHTQADALFERLAQTMGPAEMAERVIQPTMVEVGERWFRRECDVFQEHGATAFLQRKLHRLIDGVRYISALGPEPPYRVVLGTPQGDRHEGGVLILTLLLELAGWRALPLGVDLPVREYQNAVEAWHPDALAISFVLSRNINKRFRELAQITAVPIFVGGRSIVNHQRLARRHGLIPLVGPASSTLGQLLTLCQSWNRRATNNNGDTP